MKRAGHRTANKLSGRRSPNGNVQQLHDAILLPAQHTYGWLLVALLTLCIQVKRWIGGFARVLHSR